MDELLPHVPQFVHDHQVPEAAASPVLFRPREIRAGFAAAVDDLRGSGLLHAGEQWAPAQFVITEHEHPVWEWYLQLHGVTRWRADRRVWTVGPGDLLGVAPRTRHAMVEAPGANVHFYYAAVDAAPALARQPGLRPPWPLDDRVVHLPDAGNLVDPFAQLIGELTTDRGRADVGLPLAVDRLVLELTRRLGRRGPSRTFALHPAVQAVQALLDREYAASWPLRTLADRVGLAPTYLAALFAAQLGRAPHRYQTERRIARAQQLLETSDLSMTAIALEVGFGSSQHFARTFRAVTATTPSAYRRSR